MHVSVTPYQLFLAAIALYFIGERIAKVIRREKTQTIFKVIMTIGIWSVILAISLFPKTALYLSKQLGMGENLNTLIFSGFILVFIILFKMLNILERNERNITELVRKEALKGIAQSKHKSRI
ncbi:DUF2304 domain-containing protein [Candidatus Roizmanbacteria bacterium]|nr:DUF2304 domain-containing protein [Candidatus Roizmanbacteria bacterium]